MLIRLVVAFTACAVALSAATVGAQPAPPQVSAAVEATADRFHYYFQNPSTFDATGLVPHDFKQTYWGDNTWVTLAARYRAWGRGWRSEFAITPERETRGDDVDAFFLNSGDVATSGTTGRIEMRSLRVLQAAEQPFGRWTWSSAYQYRRDRNHFHARQLKTVTHSQPPGSVSFFIDGAETTISEVHELRVGVRRSWKLGSASSIEARIDVSPATYARLTTYLPLKYPGRAIVFAAPVFTLAPSLAFVHGARWPVGVSVSGLRTFSYMESRQFHREQWALAASIGRAF